MVDRVGNWFAFSRTSFCRQVTLYESLPWGDAEGPERRQGGETSSSMPFSLATAEMVSVAPFGGLIAVLGRLTDFTSHSPSFTVLSSSFASPTGSGASPPRHAFNLSAHSAATAATARALHVFTTAGERLASLSLASEDLGQSTILALGWTAEGELYTLLEESLTVVFFDMRDIAVAVTTAASSAPPQPHQQRQHQQQESSSRVSRRVPLRPHRGASVPTRPSRSPSHAPPPTLCLSPAGVLCVEDDGSGQLCGLLHQEQLRSSLIPSVRLPLQASASGAPSNSAAAAAAAGVLVRQRVSALEMVPPEWNDSGDFVVLWAQHDLTVAGAHAGKAGKMPVISPGEDCGAAATTLCAMVLQESEVIGFGDDDAVAVDGVAASVLSPSWPAARLIFPGGVLGLTVCIADSTRAAAFTSLGVLHVVRTNLSTTLYSVDLGLCRVMWDIATRAAETNVNSNVDPSSFAGAPLSSQSFAFGDVPWGQRYLDVAGNSSFAAGGMGSAAAAAAVGDGSGGAFFGGSFSPAAAHDAFGDEPPLPPLCPSPSKVEWCGTSFVLLHFFHADFQPRMGSSSSRSGSFPHASSQERCDSPMFSLLVSTQKDSGVRCERLDWSLDGSGHIVTVAEADGVRVVSDTTCYLLQEVPPCLAQLCRVQPPFPPAAQVVLAYEAYMGGDQHGIAQIRAALVASGPAAGGGDTDNVDDGAEGEEDEVGDDKEAGGEEGAMSHAEGVVYELLDAASHEFDVTQQFRLVAAASFAGETIHLRSGLPDVIVDVARRLRVLRAIREAPNCHIPLTMGQYQVLAGIEERPARLLKGSEGSVLVDRLAYLGYYQLALDVVRALHMKPTRVLARWASSFVRRHVATLSDAAVHHEVTQVLRHHPTASYVEPATTAFHLGRRELALRLLRDEPQQQRQRVLLCVRMGELGMAGRAAAASGSAELIHLVVCALVTKEAQAHQKALCVQNEDEEEKEGEVAEKSVDTVAAGAAAVDGVTAGDIFHCLIASPELLCWLLIGAQCLASWQSVARRLLLSKHWSLASLSCQHSLVQALRLTSLMHRAELRRYVADVTAALQQQQKTGASPDVEAEEKREKTTKRKKRRNRKRHAGAGDGDAADTACESDESEADGDTSAGASPARLPPPPPTHIPAPTALAAGGAVLEWIHKTKDAFLHDLQNTEELRHSKASVRPPFALIMEAAEKVRAESVRAAIPGGGGDGASKSDTTARGDVGDHRAGGGSAARGLNPPLSSSVLSHEQCVRTVLATPTTLPARDAAALRGEKELSKLKVHLAVKHSTPKLSRVVSVFDLIYELSGLEDGGDADAVEVQRAFKVGDKLFFYAKLRGLCAAERWSAVDAFLGPAPPLRKRSFFSVSEGSNGDGGGAKTPCVGYLPVVHLLVACKQNERAARYVAGAVTTAVDRVVLYMSLGAPVMALEAALVERDADLIQQIMQRVPKSAKVQAVGQKMLEELHED